MGHRRHFVKSLGLGVLAARALTASGKAARLQPGTGTGKPVRVGIVGAENSHTVSFGRIFNIQKKFPGVEVVAVWGETDEFAERAAKAGSIPRIVKDQKELLGISDAVIIDHRHPKYHAAAAAPFIEAGIPTFVDKPFTYRTQEAMELLDLATKHKTPVTCLSGVGVGAAIEDVASQIESMDNVASLIITGPADINSKYGGIFFYGVHLVEHLFKVYGDDISAVRATRHGPQTTFQFKFDSGRLATGLLARERQVLCLTREGLVEVRPRAEDEAEDLWMYAAIVKMFQTGEEPRTHESILRVVATLEAMERSVYSEQWELPIV